VWEWGIKDKAVKKMAAIILGVKISKAMQLSNWEADELSPAQQLYAATDAWICREMYLKLQTEEKHPLTMEQRDPEHYAAMQARQARIAAEEERLRVMREKKQAAKAARMAAHEAAVAAARAQKGNKRHRRRRKKNKANGENIS
jgi:ribonuclease D